MIDEATKKALLKELEKTDNVYAACHKVGVATATYYRWIQCDMQFKKDATTAQRIGRKNIADISEHALLIKIKEGNMEAIKCGLRHNHKRYMPKKEDKVIIEHRSGPKTPEEPRQTIEDFIDIMNSRNTEEAIEIRTKYEKLGPLPLKANGTPIVNEEIGMYEGYIIEHFKKKKIENGEGL